MNHLQSVCHRLRLHLHPDLRVAVRLGVVRLPAWVLHSLGIQDYLGNLLHPCSVPHSQGILDFLGNRLRPCLALRPAGLSPDTPQGYLVCHLRQCMPRDFLHNNPQLRAGPYQQRALLDLAQKRAYHLLRSFPTMASRQILLPDCRAD